MTVARLIEILNGIENKEQPVEVAIKQYNKRYPIAYCDIADNDWNHLQSNGIAHRIEVHLPWGNEEFMMTSIRKIK